MGEKKSIEELRAEAERLRKLKTDREERANLEREVKELRAATGQQSLKRKALGGIIKGAKALGKQVSSDLEAISKDLAETDKPKPRKKESK